MIVHGPPHPIPSPCPIGGERTGGRPRPETVGGEVHEGEVVNPRAVPLHRERGRRGRVRAGLVVVAALVAQGVLAAVPAHAATNTFISVSDAFVSTKFPTTNYGTWDELRVDNGQRTTYMKFNVQGLSGTVTQAVLRIYENDSSASGYLVRSVADSSWSEDTITRDNAPPASSAVAGSSGPTSPGWTQATITSLVTGNGYVSMALSSDDVDYLSLQSRESDAAPPQLVVTTATATNAPPTTPTGLAARASAPRQIDLSWAAATDDVAVTGYGIYRGGTLIASVGGSTTSFSDTTVTPATTYSYAVDAVDGAGLRSPKSASVGATTPADSAPAADPVIAAAGDIACDPRDSNFNGGKGVPNYCQAPATANLLGGISGLKAVLPLGDLQYEDATPLSEWQASYDQSWGRFKDITYPVIGNHEYYSGVATTYFSYWGNVAGSPSKGWYSFDLGSWHIVVLSGECAYIGGCGAGSPQETWLKSDLAASTKPCQLAAWHEARFASGYSGSKPAFDAFWQDLYKAGVEVVLNAHDHVYERFNPQNPAAKADSYGIREFIVGTGGKNHSSFPSVAANSAVRNTDTFGVLRMTLHAGSYDWKFLPEPGKVFTDSGTGTCFGPVSKRKARGVASTWSNADATAQRAMLAEARREESRPWPDVDSPTKLVWPVPHHRR